LQNEQTILWKNFRVIFNKQLFDLFNGGKVKKGSKKHSKKESGKGKFIALVCFSVFIVYILLSHLNYVPCPFLNNAVAYPNSTRLLSSNIDVNTVANIIDDDDNAMNILEGLGEKVEIKIYGLNDRTLEEVYNYLVTKAELDGWETYKYGRDSERNWEFAYHICTKGLMAMGHIVTSGNYIKDLTNYDVVYATVITDYVTFMRLVDKYGG